MRSQKTIGIIFILLLFAGEAFGQSGRRAPGSMSTEQIKNERHEISETRRQIGLLKSTGGTIRDGACKSYWYGAVAKKKKADNMKNRIMNRNVIAGLVEENKQLLKKYKKCFTAQLPKHPAVYKHQLDPTRSYEEFIATYNRLQALYKKDNMAARFGELGSELRRRGEG